MKKIRPTESIEYGRCILTIDGNIVHAKVENKIYRFSDTKSEIVCRKYFLDKEFPYFIDGIFDVIKDGKDNIRCYMSDPMKCLTEV